MTPTVLAAASRHAVAEFPRESCGLVVAPKDGGEHAYLPCRNVAASPSQHFTIAGEDLAASMDVGRVVGIVHSHPGHPPVPSPGDLASCEANGVPWTILRVDCSEADGSVAVTGSHSWSPTGWRAPLVGRSFHYGVLDCWALARDWYLEELGVELPDFDHGPDGWWNDRSSSFSPYEDPANLEAAGMEQFHGGSLRRGDLIVMQVRARAGKPNHVGILVDNQRCIMLHHLHGGLSTRTVYGGFWREATRFYLRRKA